MLLTVTSSDGSSNNWPLMAERARPCRRLPSVKLVAYPSALLLLADNLKDAVSERAFVTVPLKIAWP